MIDIILKSPLYSGNIGLIARISKNFNINRVKLVNPWCSINRESFKFAPNAHDTLKNMEINLDMETALEKYVIVFGTTTRQGKKREKNILSPEAAAIKALNTKGKAAVIFGPEDKGLNNKDLSLCNYLITIPTSNKHSSLNLSHAVGIIAYEFFKIFHENILNEKNVSRNTKPASFKETNEFYKRLQIFLDKIGYFKTENTLSMMNSFKKLGTKAGLTSEDISIILGVLRQASWYNNSYKKEK
jgi:tRNA/rRNA methyltransferase